MSDEPIVADPGAEVAPVAPEAPKETVTEPVVVKETISEVFKDEPAPAAPRMVPESAFLGEKKGRKAAEKALADLQASIEAGGTPTETAADINELAATHNIDPKFLNDFARTIRAQAEQGVEAKIKDIIAPIQAETKKERIDKIFTEHYDKAMAEMPEYAKVVNRDVIKALSLQPENANKTFAQLIETTYGAAVGGKRTFETTTPRADRDTGKVDFARAQTDGAYFAEIMADPVRKAEYNAGLTERLSTSL